MRHDVAVVGGGVVGGTLATALAARGLSVALVEASPPTAPLTPDLFDLRVSALNPAARRILTALGVWQLLPAQRISPFHEMRVWERGAGVHFHAGEAGLETLGHIVENRALTRALEANAERFDRLGWYRPARVIGLEVGDEDVAIELDTGLIRARLVVGADGARSSVRELAGIRIDQHEFGQTAVVAVLGTEFGHQATAWQRFLPTGPLALLPLPGGLVSIVWSTRPEHAEELLAFSPAEFAAAVELACERRLGPMTCDGRRAAFALHAHQAEHYVRERVALVGDAAHAVHPLAGQGANLGLLDAAVLADVAGAAFTQGRDPGRRAYLRRYERARRVENRLAGRVMDGFDRLFRTPGIGAVRDLGLRVADTLPEFKRLCMRYASGLAGELPTLARDDAGAVPR